MQSLFAPILTPTNRFITLGVGSGILEYIVKPSYAYTSEGTMKTWVFLNKGGSQTTYTPAFLIPLFLGIFGAVFI